MIDIGEDSRSISQTSDQIFNRIKAKNLSQNKKGIPIHIQEAHGTPKTQDQKRKGPGHIIIKTLNTETEVGHRKLPEKTRSHTYTEENPLD